MPGIDGVLMALLGLGFAAGLACLVLLVRGIERPVVARPDRWQRINAVLRSPALTGRIAGALLTGLLVLVLTHWPVAALGTAALVACWPALFGGARLEQRQISRLEALVMWTESLRDTIAARASLEQAIPATAYHAPAPIRPALIRLVGLLHARVPMDRALLALSAELNDASADKVIGSLILNTRQRGTGLAAVLSALARSARAELDQRRQISAGRASMRRSVQLVVVITVLLGLFLVIFSRDYVRPYDTLAGQLVLVVVIGLFGIGFFWMHRLAGGEIAPQLLTAPQGRSSLRDARTVRFLTSVDASVAHGLGAHPETSRGGGERA